MRRADPVTVPAVVITSPNLVERDSIHPSDAPERFAVRRCTRTNQNAINTRASIGEVDGFEHPIVSIIEDQPIEPIVMNRASNQMRTSI